MRCGKMRCGIIWRCGKHKPKEPEDNPWSKPSDGTQAPGYIDGSNPSDGQTTPPTAEPNEPNQGGE